MAIVRWDPFRDFLSMQDEVGRLFERVYGAPEAERRPRTAIWSPAVDMVEREGEIVVRAELPGLKPEDVDVTVEEDSLRIKGERTFEEQETEDNYYRIERRYGSFERLIPLPTAVRRDDVHASFKHGVLEVTMPKTEEVKPKQIKVEVAPEAKEVKAETKQELS